MIVLFATLFSSCRKATSTGTIEFVSNSAYPYAVYIDGIFQDELPGYSYQYYTVHSGYHECRVIQQTGYIVAPVDEYFDVDVYEGNQVVVSFP